MKNLDKVAYPSPKQEYMVLVRCFTYNHSQYVKSALNGFAMQQTNFPFVCLVMDDASDDGEQDIIREWMAGECDMSRAETIDIPTSIVVIVPHKTNSSCTFAFYLLKQNLYGTGFLKMKHVYPWRDKCKYEALCEGDDYWTDPLKLQKQVDFLEANPEYGMCYTNFDVLEQKTGKLIKSLFTTQPDRYPINYKTPEEFVYKKGYVCPPSWLVKRECLIPTNEQIKSLDGTFVMFTHYLCTTKVYGMLDVTATYRELPESASHSNDYSKMAQRELNLLHTQWALIDKYNLRQSLKAECEVLYYKQRLVQFILHNDKAQIAQARTIIKNRSIRDRILFALDRMPFGYYFLRFVYKSRSLIKSLV